MDGYVLQHPDFGLSNFINITPAIRWLHLTTGQRVPVYFSTGYVRQCFRDWDAITALDRQPDYGPLFGSHCISPDPDKEDYRHIFQMVAGKPWTPDFHTYVDAPPLSATDAKRLKTYVLIINGSGSEQPDYVAKKDPGKAAYDFALRRYGMDVNAVVRTMRIVATGSEADAARSPWMADMADTCFFGDIRKALRLISGAALVVANDTGLAHAAAAMNQHLIILNNPARRTANPGHQTTYF